MTTAQPNLLRILGGWTIFLGLGYWIQWNAFRLAAADQFPSGWIALVPIASVLCWLVSPGPGLWSLKRWLWSFIFFFGSLALEIHAIFAVRGVLQNPAFDSLARYAISSLEFLSFVFVWSVSFPLRERVVPWSSKIRLLWSGSLTTIGILIGSFGAHRALQILHDPRPSPTDKFHLLQALIVEGVLAAYGILIVRLFVPTTISSMRIHPRTNIGRPGFPIRS